MLTDDESTGTGVAIVSGILIGIAATLLLIRLQNNRLIAQNRHDDDYYVEGGDIFI